ncbi:MAG TPA: DUF364 domain-containing protein [Acidobacteriota bacterium]|nr:DUF364 domain-containing protein [Acidobacteriota bacterium]
MERLRSLYDKFALEPGVFVKAGLKQGWNVVIGTRGQCGMAMSFAGRDDIFGKQRLDFHKLQAFIGRDFFSVASAYLKADSWHERSVGVAATIALSQPLITPQSLLQRGYEIAPEGTDFGSCLKSDDIVAVVGYGGGIKRLIGKCRELHVTDLRPPGDFQTMLVAEKELGFVPKEANIHSEKDNEEILGRATAVSITGSTLVNGTFDELVRYSGKARLVSVYGGSAGMIPDELFAMGVHMVHSSRITDPAAFERGMIYDLNMEAVMQGTQKQQTIQPIK